MWPVIQERFAEDDFRELLLFLADRDIVVANRFIESTELAFQQLSENPETGWLWGLESQKLRDVRTLPIPGFPNHLIFFRKAIDHVRVLRILHASRDIIREMGN